MWVFPSALAIVGALVIWVGHRMVTTDRPHSTAAADALGNFIDVFDPARARADRDLESHKNMGEVLPNPDGDDGHPRWTIDLYRGRATFTRP